MKEMELNIEEEDKRFQADMRRTNDDQEPMEVIPQPESTFVNPPKFPTPLNQASDMN